MGGGGKCSSPPSPTVCDGPPSPGGRGLFFGWWILLLRLRLRAEWQCGMGWCEESKLSDLTNQQNRDCDGYVAIGLMLCSLFFGWCYVPRFLIDVTQIGFDWSMFLIKNTSNSFCAVCSSIVIWTGFFFQSHTSLTCHSARRACPGVAESTFQKAKITLLPGEKVHVKADEG